MSSRHREGMMGVWGWAFYLGASWTWCIGMYLPVLLVRDHGLWAWLAFLVPNVTGAAAMAWVLGRPGASEGFLARHGSAARVFSWVTLFFHVYFLAGMIRSLPLAALAAPVAALLLVSLGRIRVAALLVTLLSLVVFGRLLGDGFFDPSLSSIARVPSGTGPGLAALTASFGFGFLLCPYLDLTFHRARQSLDPRRARLAFGLGFGVVFTLMMVLSLRYSTLGVAVPPWWLWLHLAGQSALTLILHARELAVGFREGRLNAAAGGRVAPLVGLAFALSLPLAWLLSIAVPGHPPGGPWETGYWLILGAYGLAFPTYVWVFVIWAGRGPSGARSWTVALAAVAAAFPLHWWGFVGGRPLWIVPGVLLLLAAGPLARWAEGLRASS